MQVDIPLAGWVLSVVSFAAGTIFPVIFRRLSYEGVSLKQPMDVRAVFQDDRSRSRCELVFGTLVKIVNASRGALIIDQIEARALVTPIVRFTPIGVDIRGYHPQEPVRVPPSPYSAEESPDYFPLLVKGETERVLSLGLWFSYPPTSVPEPIAELERLATTPGIKVDFRINGKFRPYMLHAKPSARWKLPEPPSPSNTL